MWHAPRIMSFFSIGPMLRASAFKSHDISMIRSNILVDWNNRTKRQSAVDEWSNRMTNPQWYDVPGREGLSSQRIAWDYSELFSRAWETPLGPLQDRIMKNQPICSSSNEEMIHPEDGVSIHPTQVQLEPFSIESESIRTLNGQECCNLKAHITTRIKAIDEGGRFRSFDSAEKGYTIKTQILNEWSFYDHPDAAYFPVNSMYLKVPPSKEEAMRFGQSFNEDGIMAWHFYIDTFKSWLWDIYNDACGLVELQPDLQFGPTCDQDYDFDFRRHLSSRGDDLYLSEATSSLTGLTSQIKSLEFFQDYLRSTPIDWHKSPHASPSSTTPIFEPTCPSCPWGLTTNDSSSSIAWDLIPSLQDHRETQRKALSGMLSSPFIWEQRNIDYVHERDCNITSAQFDAVASILPYSKRGVPVMYHPIFSMCPWTPSRSTPDLNSSSTPNSLDTMNGDTLILTSRWRNRWSRTLFGSQTTRMQDQILPPLELSWRSALDAFLTHLRSSDHRSTSTSAQETSVLLASINSTKPFRRRSGLRCALNTLPLWWETLLLPNISKDTSLPEECEQMARRLQSHMLLTFYALVKLIESQHLALQNDGSLFLPSPALVNRWNDDWLERKAFRTPFHVISDVIEGKSNIASTPHQNRVRPEQEVYETSQRQLEEDLTPNGHPRIAILVLLVLAVLVTLLDTVKYLVQWHTGNLTSLLSSCIMARVIYRHGLGSTPMDRSITHQPRRTTITLASPCPSMDDRLEWNLYNARGRGDVGNSWHSDLITVILRRYDRITLLRRDLER